MDERHTGIAIDLAAQPAHVDVDDVGLGIEVVIPHRLQQHGAGDYLAGVAHQVLQQPELAGLELDGPSCTLHAAGKEVHLQVRDDEPSHRRRGAGTGVASPDQRLEPGTYSASPILADGKIYATSEDGVTTVYRAGREFEIVATNSLPGYTLSTPAVAGGNLYIRAGRALYAIGGGTD